MPNYPLSDTLQAFLDMLSPDELTALDNMLADSRPRPAILTKEDVQEIVKGAVGEALMEFSVGFVHAKAFLDLHEVSMGIYRDNLLRARDLNMTVQLTNPEDAFSPAMWAGINLARHLAEAAGDQPGDDLSGDDDDHPFADHREQWRVWEIHFQRVGPETADEGGEEGDPHNDLGVGDTV